MTPGSTRRLAAALAAALVLVPLPASADEAASRAIDLSTALAIALGHNDALAAEAVDVAIADAQVRGHVGADDLVLEADVGARTFEREPVGGPFFQETALDELAVSLGIWKPLASGGRVGLVLREDVARSTVRIDPGTGAPFDIDTTVHAPRAELVVIQPLLAGRGTRSSHAARRRAAATRDAEEAERVRAEAALVLDVTVTYWELAYAAREVEIRQSALALARAQLEITRARAEVGKGSELEVLAVEQAIAAREAALLAARQAEEERALDLRVLLAADDGDPRRFAAADPVEATPVAAPPADDALAAAIQWSPDLRVLDHHARAAAVERDAADGELAPRLDLILRGGPAGNDTSLGDAWSQMGTFDSYAASATLSFRLPIGNTTAEARRDAARLREKRLRHAREETRGRLTAEVQRAVDAIALTDRRIAAAEAAVTLARRNVELELARWETGVGTNFDVLERQDQLAAAEAALARAHADHRLAHARLAYLTGE